MTTDIRSITTLLEEAAKKLAARNFDGADHDYRQVFELVAERKRLDSSLTDPEKDRLNELTKHATDGINKAKLRDTGNDRVARLRGQFGTSGTEERRLVILQQLIDLSRDGAPSDEESESYRKLLAEVGQRILIEARQALIDNNPTRAAAMLEGQSLFQVSGSKEEREAAERVTTALKTDKSWQGEATRIATQISERQNTPVSAVPFVPVTSTPPMSTPTDPPRLSAEEASTNRAEELVTQAEGYLRRSPTASNYKEVLSRIDQALGSGGLSAMRRGEIEVRRATVERDYELFRKQFQQLVTARQIADIEIELIAARELQIKGIEIGPDGEELAVVIADKLKQLRERLLRVGKEQATTADRLVEDGRNFLDVSALHNAVSRYERVIALLQGKEIKVSDGPQPPDTLTAITSIQNLLLEYPEIKDGIKSYEERREAILRLPSLLEGILPTYREAERLYNEGGYREAMKQVEKVKSLVANRLPSVQLDLLDRSVREAFEARTAATIQSLLDKAQIAFSRDDVAGVEATIKHVREVEPQFQSEVINNLRAQASALIEEVKQGEQVITSGLAKAQAAKTGGDLKTAEQETRTVLSRRPGNEKARTLLDGIISQQVSTVLVASDQLADTGTLKELNEFRPDLSKLTNQVLEISDVAARHNISEQIKDAIIVIDRRIKSLGEKKEQATQLETVLTEFNRSLEASQYEAAAQWIVKARGLTRSDPRVSRAEENLKTKWRDHLHRRARQFLDTELPQPDAALNELAIVEKRELNDGMTTELCRRAKQLKILAEAKAAFEQGEFTTVITLLSGIGAGANSSELTLLRDARRREVQRLTNLEQWAEILTQMSNMDSTEEGIPPGIFRRATGELALREAEEELRKKLFEKCEQSITEAEQQRIEEITKRATGLHSRLEVARKIYQRVEALVQIAQGHESQFKANQNREELLKAIVQMDKALADPELLPGDLQREQIQQQRDKYQHLYHELITAERRRLFALAEQSLHADQIVDAMSHFRAVQALAPDGQDPEAAKGLDRSLQRLAELRVRTVEEVTIMLNLHSGGQRGITPSSIIKKIAEIEALRKIEPEHINPPLNKALESLKEAEQFCRQADEALNAARQRWAALRSKTQGSEAIDRKEVDLDIERGVGIFSSRTYIHSDLDRTNIESLPNRFDKDVRELSEANRISLTIRQGIEREPRNMNELMSQFERLRTLEESLYQMTLILIDRDRVASVTRPGTNAERYPRQHAIIRSLREQIESLRRAELTVPDLTALRQIMVQRSQTENLMEQLDREKRFSA